MAMPGVLVLVWLTGRCGRGRSVALALVLIAALYVGGQHTLDRQRARYVVHDLPAGLAAVEWDTNEKLELMLTRTAPGQFFFQAVWPSLYVPLGLRNPVYVDDVGTDDSTRPEDVTQAIQQLDAKAVQYVLWAPSLERPEPGGERGYHLAPLVDYLHARYRRVKRLVEGEELWRRKQSPEM
jgi:hypothetical protein